MPLDTFTPTKVSLMVVAVLNCCAVAVAFFRLVERPSNVWLRRHLLHVRAATPRAWSRAV
jgi:hypothetical protein